MVQSRACVTSDRHFECVRWVHQTTVTTGRKGASRSHQLRTCEEEQLMQRVPSIRGTQETPRVRDVDRATHVLHIGIAGPYIESHERHHYFLVGALRLPDRPLLVARPLNTRTSVEVCAALERMTSFFESLSFEGFEITDSPRIKRLHSDRAREFTALHFQKLLSNHRSIYHTLTTGCDPQTNGTAEEGLWDL